MTVRDHEQVRLRNLSLVPDGDGVLLGDPDSGTFVTIPAVGATVVTALRDGRTIAEARDLAEAEVGQPVDIEAFLNVLDELGFVDDGTSNTPTKTAPIQRQSWQRGPDPRYLRPFFGRIAWTVYAAAGLFCVLVFLGRPDLFPLASDVLAFSDVGLSMLLFIVLSCSAIAAHEGGHWLAARALDLRTRFGLDRRMYFFVAETDLSQLWSVPRRQRYGPLLAGLAVDVVLLAALLGVQLVRPGMALVEALVFAIVVSALWQCMIFLRTDLYAVLVVATGCRDLWRVKSLLLRRAVRRLSAEQAAELAAADPRDVQVGRWFRWLWLFGCVVATAYFAVFTVPVLGFLVRWTADGLTAGGWRFWWTLAGSLFFYAPFLAVGAFAVRDFVRGRLGRG